MSKESIVEIPEGSGNQYRYVYEGGKTVYRGPVGSAPKLGEEEFMAAMESGKRYNLFELSAIAKQIDDVDTLANMFVSGGFFDSMHDAKSAAHALKSYDEGDLKRLEREVNFAVEQVMRNFEDYEFEEGRADYIIDTIAPDAAGTHMPEYVVDQFYDILHDEAQEDWDEENEWYEPDVWDNVIEPKLNYVSFGLNMLVDYKEPEGYNVVLYFGHPESGGYGLQMIVEKAD